MSTTPTPSKPLGVAFTNATVPAPPKEERVILDSEIVAKPLGDPDFIGLKPHNPNLSLYWGNRAVGDKESRMRINQLLSKGFTYAEAKDVYMVNRGTGQKLQCPDALMVDGRIIHGDLILLKIPRADYIGQQKWNNQTAQSRVQKPGTMAAVKAGDSTSAHDGDQLVTGRVQDITRNPEVASKVAFYTPSPEQAALLTGANSSKDK